MCLTEHAPTRRRDGGRGRHRDGHWARRRVGSAVLLLGLDLLADYHLTAEVRLFAS